MVKLIDFDKGNILTKDELNPEEGTTEGDRQPAVKAASEQKNDEEDEEEEEEEEEEGEEEEEEVGEWEYEGEEGQWANEGDKEEWEYEIEEQGWKFEGGAEKKQKVRKRSLVRSKEDKTSQDPTRNTYPDGFESDDEIDEEGLESMKEVRRPHSPQRSIILDGLGDTPDRDQKKVKGVSCFNRIQLALRRNGLIFLTFSCTWRLVLAILYVWSEFVLGNGSKLTYAALLWISSISILVGTAGAIKWKPLFLPLLKSLYIIMLMFYLYIIGKVLFAMNFYSTATSAQVNYALWLLICLAVDSLMSIISQCACILIIKRKESFKT